MATVAIVLKTTKKLSNDEFAVALRVTHERKARYININSLVIDQNKHFRCSVRQWKHAIPEDNGFGKFSKSMPEYKHLNSILLEKLMQARKILNRYDLEGIPFDFESFENEMRGKEVPSVAGKNIVSLKDYYEKLINELIELNKIGSSTVYSDTISLLEKFRPGSFIGDVNVKFLEAFESFLRSDRGNKDTTISVKLRNLQRVMNLAIADGLIKQDQYPFGERKYSINKRLNHKTRKRFVTIKIISQIKNLYLEGEFHLNLAKDIFLFSYYTRGMNFIDIAGLKWSDIINNEIYYIRKKTSQPFYIPINIHVSSILEKYKKIETLGSYIFPIYNDNIHRTGKQKYTRKKTALKQINGNLKRIGGLIGEADLNLTTYVSRHSYATNLKRAGVSISYISEALGHQSESQTQVYLDEFEKGKISEVESVIYDL